MTKYMIIKSAIQSEEVLEHKAIPLWYIPSLARCILGMRQIVNNFLQVSESAQDVQNLFHPAEK